MRDDRRGRRVSAACLSLALASCAQPVGPTVQVLPPPGKAFAAFELDERECSLHTNDIVRPMIERTAETQLGTAAVGAVLGAAVGGAVGRGRGAVIGTAAGTLAGAGAGADQAAAAQARIQQTYDSTYAGCMAAHGDLVQAAPAPQTIVVAAPPVIVQPAPYVVTPRPTSCSRPTRRRGGDGGHQTGRGGRDGRGGTDGREGGAAGMWTDLALTAAILLVLLGTDRWAPAILCGAILMDNT